MAINCSYMAASGCYYNCSIFYSKVNVSMSEIYYSVSMSFMAIFLFIIIKCLYFVNMSNFIDINMIMYL